MQTGKQFFIFPHHPAALIPGRCLQLFCTLFFYLLAFTAGAQKKHLSRVILRGDSTMVFFENNYIRDANKVMYQPYNIQRPFQDLNFDIFGSRLVVSAYRLVELIRKGGYSSTGSFQDTTKQDAPLFDLQTLHYSVVRNGTLETGWRPAAARAHMDTFVNDYFARDSTFYRQGYLFYDGHLYDGDTLTLSFRSAGEKPFMNIHFRKRSPLATPPHLMGSFSHHDGSLPLEKFIQRALETYQSWNQGYYEDWPGIIDDRNDKLFPETKIAFFFNLRRGAQHDSLFEYRLVADGNGAAPWKKSDNIIFVSGLSAGKQYRLEVRSTERPQYVFTKRFYVPGYWYQTTGFKLGAAFLMLLLGLVFFFFYKSRRQKMIQEEQRNRLKTLYAQLSPHFVFNALGSIQGLLNEGRLEQANQYLSGFGSLLRNTLDSSEKNSITLKEELQHLATYIHLEQLRRPFTFTQKTGEGISLADTEMLPLFFQPLVENAVKHGYRGREFQLHLSLSLHKQGRDLQVVIQDNGKGFDTGATDRGKGLRLMGERVHLYNRISRQKKIVSEISSDSNGTIIRIKFLNWLDQ